MTVGDIVWLRSGGGPMTIVATNDDLITCTWFEVIEGGWGKCGRGTFPVAALSKAPASDGEQSRVAN